MKTRFTILAATAVCCLSVSGVTMAATPASGGYDETNVLGQVNDAAPASGTSPAASVGQDSGSPSSGARTVAADTSSSSGSLPFTGIEVGVIAMFGILLASTGVLMRRRLGSNRN